MSSLKDCLSLLNRATVAKHCSCKERDYHESNKSANSSINSDSALSWKILHGDTDSFWHFIYEIWDFTAGHSCCGFGRCTVRVSLIPPRLSSHCSRPHWDINRSSCVIMSRLCRYFRDNPDCWGVLRDHLRLSRCLGWTFKPSWSFLTQAVVVRENAALWMDDNCKKKSFQIVVVDWRRSNGLRNGDVTCCLNEAWSLDLFFGWS